MPRPTDKTALLDLGQKSYEDLKTYITSLDPADTQTEFPENYLNRNVRDVLAHLHHWHKMMLSWYKEGMQGKKPIMPAEGYTWKTTSDLNRQIQKTYCKTSLKQVVDLLDDSHKKVRKIILSHSDEELFTKKKYPWTGSTSLGAYLISSTSSHYDWALKLIRKCLKTALIAK